MKNIIKSSLIISAIVFASFAFTASSAMASTCSTALNGHITSAPGAGSPASATATNSSTGCTAQVTFTSYKVFIAPGNSGWLDTQVLFDSQTLTLNPGETKTFTINTPGCYTQLDIYEGPVQPHLTDASGGFPGQHLLGWQFLENNLCTNTTPLTCSPSNQTVNTGDIAAFSANGGSGNYSWTGGGSPSTGAGTNFSTTYSTSGSKTVTVSDGTQTASCNVTVNQPVQQITCSPSNQTVNTGDIAAFSATGGNGSYSWSGGGSPATGVGANFSTTYSTSGSKTVTVTDGSRSATCNITVNQPVQQISCAPANQNVNTGDIAVFTATGGTGSYSWSGGGSPTTGVGSNFSTTYSTSGSKTVTVTDGSHSATCNVNVNQAQQNLTCAPVSQNGNVGDTLTFSATGGTGSYSWNTSDASPSSGSGASFSTQFNNVGSKTVTVTSGSQTAQCLAYINQLTCNAPNVYLTATTNITQYSATVNAYVDPQGHPATYYFQYGQNNSLGYTSGQQTISSAQNVSYTINGLQPNTTYYYRLTTQNSCGTNQTFIFTFTTTGDTYNPPSQVYCNPQNQNVNVNDWVNMNASGGSGNFSWYTSGDASPSSGYGQSFGTRFNTPGTKFVTVNSSAGGSAQCTVNVNGNQNSSFQITKNVLNRTLGQNVYVNNVEAQAQDMVEFEIRVQTQSYSNYNYNSNQITLRDNLPYGLSYVQGSTRVNGNQVADGITQGGIYLNNNSGEQVVRFLATVNEGQTSGTLTNQAIATSGNNTQSAYASVNIHPRGTVLGAADVVTGPEDVLPIAMLLGLISSAGIYYFFFNKNSQKLNFASVIAAENISAAPAKKNDLEKLLDEIRAKEKKADA